MMKNPSLIMPISFSEFNPGDMDISPTAVQKLNNVFEGQIQSGLHPGAQFVVLKHGQVIFDGAAGLANIRKNVPVTKETPFLIFSSTKAFTAICIHHLVEAGKLELDAPVAVYWPEFGCKGKQSATIRHTLLHQAGIPTRGMPFQLLIWDSRALMARFIANLPAEWEPGSRMEYHLVNSGFILGELIYRVSGLTCQEYLQKFFIEPLGMKNTYTGLPFHLHPKAAHIYNQDPMQRGAAFLFNRAIYRRLFIPAASINNTARDLAVFYQMLNNGGTYAGKQYLKPETIQRATVLAYDGPNGNTGRRIRWSMGFTVGGYSEFPDKDIRMMGKNSTQFTFGHPGQGGAALAWADPESGIVFSFVNNRFQDAESVHRRFEVLADCVWDIFR
jgi:CubicO group peptidase (beta-lactamase class C family)